MTAAVAILAVFVLTFGTAYFVAQEFAYVSADRVELARQADAGDKRAASAIRVMERLSFMLSAAQVGITVTGLIVGLIAEPAFAQVVRPLLESAGLPDSAVPGVSVAVGFAVATIIQMVLGELFPKNLALATPERLAKVLAASTHVYLAVSGPLVRLFDNSAAWLLRKAGIEPVEELHHGATLEELGHVIGESEAGGSLSSQLSGILGRALYFSEHTAGEAMVPRPDVRGVRADAAAAAVVELVATHGHSNYPVRGEETDEVVGVVGVRELMDVAPADVASTLVRDIARPPLLVPDSLPLPALVERMQDAGDEFACVVDEYGGLAGIVTLEDVSEELFGDITDETDQQAVPVTRDGDWWQLDAGLRVDEAAARTGLPLHESDDYDTVAGLIVAELGRFAEPTDRLVVGTDVDGRDRVEIEVVTVARHVPELVRLRRPGLVRTDGNAEAAP
ncbi:hemolysin family protein [Jiangella rhizosphaerae]|uniref:HlyC/CorC family transporter n=1 Tax=Jiangella rhizosphaerae TaxID=2293569 RepID=A0A418KP52_9ACTN|nr:hemolysin family protein [Jiangella rhizosphaerae]RIQ20918.1 HlyC/CorC family transporter [Jiangella rhizosphaerae]